MRLRPRVNCIVTYVACTPTFGLGKGTRSRVGDISRRCGTTISEFSRIDRSTAASSCGDRRQHQRGRAKRDRRGIRFLLGRCHLSGARTRLSASARVGSRGDQQEQSREARSAHRSGLSNVGRSSRNGSSTIRSITRPRETSQGSEDESFSARYTLIDVVFRPLSCVAIRAKRSGRRHITRWPKSGGWRLTGRRLFGGCCRITRLVHRAMYTLSHPYLRDLREPWKKRDDAFSLLFGESPQHEFREVTLWA